MHLESTHMIEMESTPESRTRLRWAPEQRLAFIDDRLYWEGSFNRADLIDRFKISVAQASADIAAYRAAAPNNAAYDLKAKSYVAGPSIKPVVSQLDPGQYLAELRARREGIGFDVISATFNILPAEIVPLPARPISREVLREVVLAIKGRQILACTYLSFQEGFTGRRSIEPHTLVFDGMRWHVRARDVKQDDFRDFTLGRISDVVRQGVAEQEPSRDEQWHSWVRLRLAPHPGLTPGQRRAVRADYGFSGNTIDLEVRAALVLSTKRRLRLDLDNQPAISQHLVLLSQTPIGQRPP